MKGGNIVEFIATYWWLWLVVFVASMIYIIFNMVRRIKGESSILRRIRGGSGDSFESDQKAFFAGTEYFFIAALVAYMSGIALVISIIINLINYLKA